MRIVKRVGRSLRSIVGFVPAEEPYRRVPCAFETWSIDASGSKLTVDCTGSSYQQEVQLALDEGPEEVRLTASYVVMPSRSSKSGARVGRRRSAQTYIASSELSEALGERRVVDTMRPAEDQRPRRRPSAWPYRYEMWNTVMTFDGADIESFDRDGHHNFVVTIRSRPEDLAAIKALVDRTYGPGVEIVRDESPPERDEI